MRKSTLFSVAFAFVLGGAVGAFALLGKHALGPTGFAGQSPRPQWNEVAWPFLVDQWGKGKAFHCAAEDCGTEVYLYPSWTLGGLRRRLDPGDRPYSRQGAAGFDQC